jgi:processive 1,2-diacylglycerol beta-glucosyltransferase
MGQRVLIVTASVGSGHNTAARVLEAQLRGEGGVGEVHTLDVLESTSDLYRVFYDDAYFGLVDTVPWLVGWGYDANEAPFNSGNLVRLWNRINTTASARAIKGFQPDLVICTHWLPARLVALMLTRDGLQAQLAVVTTDFDFQGLWLPNTFHDLFVARAETKAHMKTLGVPADRITVSGIPVEPVLGDRVDDEAVRRRFDLRPGLPTLLISAGAAGGSYTRSVVQQTMAISEPFQAIVVCGRNEELRKSLSALTLPQAERYRVLGYTTDMADLMRVATLFVGKPGGLSSSECMAAGLPMVLINPIPGQEERNADYLLEEGAAIRCNYETTIGFKIASLLQDPERVTRMAAAARRIGRPDASAVITAAAHVVRPPLWISRAAQRSILEASERNIPAAEFGTDERIRTLADIASASSVGLVTTAQLRSLLPASEPLPEPGTRLTISAAQLTGLRRLRIDPDLLHTVRRNMGRDTERTLILQS